MGAQRGEENTPCRRCSRGGRQGEGPLLSHFSPCTESVRRWQQRNVQQSGADRQLGGSAGSGGTGGDGGTAGLEEQLRIYAACKDIADCLERKPREEGGFRYKPSTGLEGRRRKRASAMGKKYSPVIGSYSTWRGCTAGPSTAAASAIVSVRVAVDCRTVIAMEQLQQEPLMRQGCCSHAAARPAGMLQLEHGTFSRSGHLDDLCDWSLGDPRRYLHSKVLVHSVSVLPLPCVRAWRLPQAPLSARNILIHE